jgi:phosphatidylglycerol:prolipoprotein diacylglycerol transferase
VIFPNIDPIAVSMGPLAIRWYSLAYIFGLLGGWFFILQLLRHPPYVMSRSQLSNFLSWAIISIIIGGRIGYVFFYNFSYYIQNPIEIFFVWQGGMSFHGGFSGIVIAIILFSKINKISLLCFSDLIASAAPIGLFFGRIANFINGELYGRVTDVSWAIVFPNGGDTPRHPSQLYEAALEGIGLYLIILILILFANARKLPGLLMGVFLFGYGTSRIIIEFFREPDSHIGFLIGSTTIGQWLSVPLVLAGIYFISCANSKSANSKNILE